MACHWKSETPFRSWRSAMVSGLILMAWSCVKRFFSTTLHGLSQRGCPFQNISLESEQTIFLTKLVPYVFNVRSWESNEVLFLSWLYFFLIYCPFSALPWEVESTGTCSVCRSSWLTLSLEGFPVTPGLKKSEGHTPKMELLRLSLKREHLKLSSKKPRRIARLHASLVVSLLQI